MNSAIFFITAGISLSALFLAQMMRDSRHLSVVYAVCIVFLSGLFFFFKLPFFIYTFLVLPGAGILMLLFLSVVLSRSDDVAQPRNNQWLPSLFLTGSGLVMVAFLIVRSFHDTVPMEKYVQLMLLFFVLGIYGILSTRNIIRIMVQVIIIVIAACVNFGAGTMLHPDSARWGKEWMVILCVVIFMQVLFGIVLFTIVYRAKHVLTVNELDNDE